MCCKLGEILQVGKADGEWCRHCTTRTACDIYDTRPEVCRSYYCVYMLTDLSDDWRPTKCKFMISALPDGALVITVDKSRPDGWKNAPYIGLTREWAQTRRIVVLIGLRALAIYPDHIEELGMIGNGYGLGTIPDPTGRPIPRTIRVDTRTHQPG